MPCGAIKEVHGSEEPGGGHGTLTSFRWLHCVIVIDATLVGDELTKVTSGLESRVREALSCRGGHLVVPDTRMSHRQSRLAVPIMDGMHGAVCSGNFSSIEPKSLEKYQNYPVAANGFGFSSSRSLVKLLRVS